MTSDTAPDAGELNAPLEIAATALANVDGMGGGIPAGPYQRALAAAVLESLAAAGYVLMAPQDIEWGVCPNPSGDPADGPEPHRVSLSLCSGCLEYDPD